MKLDGDINPIKSEKKNEIPGNIPNNSKNPQKKTQYNASSMANWDFLIFLKTKNAVNMICTLFTGQRKSSKEGYFYAL